MNILILSWRGPKHPNAGGAESSTHEHAKGWVKAGHDVTLFTSTFLGGEKEELINGVKIIRKGRQIFGVQWEAFKWYLLGSHPRFNIVVDQFHGIPFFTPLYVSAKKLAFIHEVTKEVWRFNPWPRPFNLLPAILGSLFEQFIFKWFYKYIHFMTVSDSTRKDLMHWGIPEKNITIIHNGITKVEKGKSFPKEKKKTVIYLGTLSKDKGIEDALKVFSLLNQDDSWQFWVVGKVGADTLSELKSKTKKLEIDKEVTFWNYVDENKKYELLTKAHVLINPSIREGWGLVVIEAASVGTPTVGYNISGLRDSIVNNKTGILCESNPNACAEEIQALLNDQKKYKQISKNALKWSSNFDWEKASKQSLKLISDLVQNKS